MLRARDTKSSIEDAALRLFVARGVAETSIRDIAVEARVSLGAMYNHYRSKEELAWTLFSTNFSEMGMELQRRAKEQDGIQNQLPSMIEYVFRQFDENWVLVSYVFLARHQHLSRVTPDLGNPYTAFRFVIAEAVRRGEVPRQSVELATSMVTGAIIQTIDSRILRRIRSKLAELAEPVSAACLRLLQS